MRTTGDALNAWLFIVISGNIFIVILLLLHGYSQSDVGLYSLLFCCHCIVTCHASYVNVLWKRWVRSSGRGLVTCTKFIMGDWSSEWGPGVQRADLVRMKNHLLSLYDMYKLSRCCIALYDNCAYEMFECCWILLYGFVWFWIWWITLWLVILNRMNNIWLMIDCDVDEIWIHDIVVHADMCMICVVWIYHDVLCIDYYLSLFSPPFYVVASVLLRSTNNQVSE